MIVSLVVLVMHLGTFPPTKLLSGIIATELNVVFVQGISKPNAE